MGRQMRTSVLVVAIVLVGAPSAGAFKPQPFTPAYEAQNYSKINERQTIYDTPAYQALLAQISAQNQRAALAAQAADPGREFATDLCGNGMNGCAGDVRLYDWAKNGDGIVQPVLFTARDGATISGHVWATSSGPAKRPGIVFSNGSVQADEQLYWFVAQTLAKAGYVVLTYDPQGQGQSDTMGAGTDRMEGFPAQSDGRPYIDGTEDAVNFFFSNSSHPYEPIPSCNSSTSHAAKQNSRVAQGLDAAYNPYSSMLDTSEVGLIGHSYGAQGVSYIGQTDPRIKAVVALDNLAGATNPSEKGCVDASQRSGAPITKPALGFSADYFLPPTPNTSQPDPLAKTKESLAYTGAGVDSGEIIIRGGTHFDFDFIPNQAFGATLRGADEIDWYSTAWFDRYLKHDPSADARLLTTRWRTDGQEAAIDPNHDANMFSQYYDSRLDVHLAAGNEFDCEDLRTGCAGMRPADGYPGDYSYAAIDTTPEAGLSYAAIDTTPEAGFSSTSSAGAAGTGGLYACSRGSRTVFHPHVVRGRLIVRAVIKLNGRVAARARGRDVRTITLPGLPGTKRYRVLVLTYTRHGLARRTRRTLSGCGRTRTPPVTLKARQGRRRTGYHTR